MKEKNKVIQALRDCHAKNNNQSKPCFNEETNVYSIDAWESKLAGLFRFTGGYKDSRFLAMLVEYARMKGVKTDGDLYREVVCKAGRWPCGGEA